MKKGLIIFGVLAMFAVVSCKKDRVCSCTITYSGSLGNSTSTADTTLVDMTKKDAKAKCESFNSTSTLLGETVTQTCELK